MEDNLIKMLLERKALRETKADVVIRLGLLPTEAVKRIFEGFSLTPTLLDFVIDMKKEDIEKLLSLIEKEEKG